MPQLNKPHHPVGEMKTIMENKLGEDTIACKLTAGCIHVGHDYFLETAQQQRRGSLQCSGRQCTVVLVGCGASLTPTLAR